mmetsp:Transcript_9475/g.18154  ORF Transcript_9475/g.18154 Transcript_9475/m.18154 type:complete len:209 (+) Transcript_9475:1874-2500(+)
MSFFAFTQFFFHGHLLGCVQKQGYELVVRMLVRNTGHPHIEHFVIIRKPVDVTLPDDAIRHRNVTVLVVFHARKGFRDELADATFGWYFHDFFKVFVDFQKDVIDDLARDRVPDDLTKGVPRGHVTKQAEMMVLVFLQFDFHCLATIHISFFQDYCANRLGPGIKNGHRSVFPPCTVLFETNLVTAFATGLQNIINGLSLSCGTQTRG